MSEAMEAAILRNRNAKAKKLARHILNHTAHVAEGMTQDEWNHVAASCNVNAPSQETIKETVRVLEEIAL
jgi:hypothetical protein